MRTFKYLFILIGLAFTAISRVFEAASPHAFPAQLSGLEDAKPDKYYNKVKDIPTPVMDAFRKALGGQELRMADSDGAWNKTDVVDDPSLPFRRLIWAAQIKGRYVIHYEMGGVRYNTRYMIATPDEGGEKWVVLWAASGSKPVPDYSAFIADLKDGKLNIDSRMIHQK